MERYLFHHISRPFCCCCCCFSKFLMFDFFLRFFFVFVNMGPYRRKNFKRHLLWKYITDLLQNIMHTSREGLYQSCIKFGEISNFVFLHFFFFFFVFVNMGPYEKNFPSDILSESPQQICSQKWVHSARTGHYQSCIKNCEVSNFGFWHFFCCCCPFIGTLTW